MQVSKQFLQRQTGIAKDYIKILAQCGHCGEPVAEAKKLCDLCTTKDKRQALCKENNEIRVNAGLRILKCNYCNNG